MHDTDIEALHAAIAALEGQRATLGDAVVDLATAPLRARLIALQRPAGLQHRQVAVLFVDVVGSTAGAPRWTVPADRLDRLRLPGTLVGLLQARLEALPAGKRSAARQASVIGHVFWDDALQALDAQAPQALPALQRAAFVRPNETSDFEGTPQRQVDHHLLHQVTYDTLLKAERRLGHGGAARWLSERTQGRAGPERGGAGFPGAQRAPGPTGRSGHMVGRGAT